MTDMNIHKRTSRTASAFVAVASALTLMACDSAAEDAPIALVEVTPSMVAAMPPEPITAILGVNRQRFTLPVSSPQACLDAARTMTGPGKRGNGEGTDNNGVCMGADGRARLIIDAKKLFVPFDAVRGPMRSVPSQASCPDMRVDNQSGTAYVIIPVKCVPGH